MKISEIDRLNFNDIDKRTLTFLTDMPLVEPESIQIDITNKCNLNCIYCWNNSPFLKKKKPKVWFEKKIDFKYFKKIIDSLVYTNTIIFSGEGEPFTHPDIMKMIEYVKAKQKKLIIVTNGTLITKPKIKKIVELAVDKLVINISAATPNAYKKMHSNKGYTTFNKLKSCLIYLKKIKKSKLFIKPNVRIVNVITKLNYLEVLKMIKFGIAIGADELWFKPVQSKHKDTDFLVLNKKDVKKIKEELKNSELFIKNNLNEFYIKLLDEKYAKFGSYTKNLAKNIGCYSSWHFGRFLINKSYTPCCNVPIIIPIKKYDTFEEIWKDKKFRKFRNKVKLMDLGKKLICKDCKELCPHFIRNLALLEEMKKSFSKIKADNTLEHLSKNYSKASLQLLEKKLKILFHTINGAGLGHLSRSMILAKSLKAKEPTADIRFITESKFTKMLDDSNFTYYKLPYSHVDINKYSLDFIKNENKKSMILIINEFDPDVIIYDTYPFDEVLNDKCSIKKKNILVLRKLDDIALKNFLQNEIIDKFQLIIFPHSEEEFKNLDIIRNLQNNNKFKFAGSFVREINSNAIYRIKKRYKITSKKFNILAIAGGGGEDEHNKGTSEFFKIIKNVNSLVKNKIKRMNLIVVTGPLFKGKLKIKNAIIETFEPNLMELMKSVDLIISVGGYNLCNEICKVRTPAIIIPFSRDVENQKERVELLAKSGAVICMNKPDEEKLSSKVIDFYNNPSKLYKMKKSFKKIKFKIGNEIAAKEILKIISEESEYNVDLKYNFEKLDRNKKITIVIPTYNRKLLLKNCLISIFRQNYPKNKYEVIVVDDGSTDETEKMIKSLKPTCNLKYFYWPRKEEFKLGEPKNRVAIARNVGIENARGEIIFFVDSDMILDKNCVSQHVKMHKKYKKVVVIGYRNLLFKRDTQKSNIVDLVLNKKVPFQDDSREVNFGVGDKPWRFLYTNNASIKKNDLIRVGMFEKTFINKFWGVEDVELGYRLFKAGLLFKFDKKAVGYHQYHKTEYGDPHNMFVGLKKNWEFIHKLHPSEEIYNRFIFSYDYELLSLGSKCNNNCSVCNLVQRKSTKNKTTKQIKNELKELREKSESVLISGGEPTIRPDILDIISYAKSLNFRKIALETNGRMLSYKDFSNKIITAGANQFFVYIHGSTANVHESITNKKGSFEQTIKGIRNLTDKSQVVEAKVCVTKENYKDLSETFIMLNKFGVKYIQFIMPRIPEVEGMIPKYAKIAKEIKKVFDYEERGESKAFSITVFI